MPVQIADDGAIRTVTIDRPDRRNALDSETLVDLAAALDGARDAGARAIVLTGVGGHFSAGGDATVITEAAGDDAAGLRLMELFHGAVTAIWQNPLPVIGAVSGVVYGAGFSLALACDLVHATRDARFCQVFIRRGLVPDSGAAWLLPRVVGMQRAKRMMLLGEEFDAATAQELGIVDELLDTPEACLARATEHAGVMAEHSPHALLLSKRLINASADTTLAGSLQQEAIAQTSAINSDVVQEAFARFVK